MEIRPYLQYLLGHRPLNVFFCFFSLVNFIASNGVSQLAKGYFEGPHDEKKEVKTERKKRQNKKRQNKTKQTT